MPKLRVRLSLSGEPRLLRLFLWCSEQCFRATNLIMDGMNRWWGRGWRLGNIQDLLPCSVLRKSEVSHWEVPTARETMTLLKVTASPLSLLIGIPEVQKSCPHLGICEWAG